MARFQALQLAGRHAGEGALIGAAAGMIAGGLIGNSMDQQQQEQLRQQAPQTYVRVDQGQPLGVADVKALAKAGISEDVIISQIRNSRTVYHLSAADIIDLRNAGVSDKVIDYMINTPSTAGAAAPASTVMLSNRRRRHRRKRSWSHRGRVTSGLAANGYGMAMVLGGRDTGVIRLTRTPFGFAAIGIRDRTVGTGQRDTGADSRHSNFDLPH